MLLGKINETKFQVLALNISMLQRWAGRSSRRPGYDQSTVRSGQQKIDPPPPSPT